jgi:hypothetical protein
VCYAAIVQFIGYFGEVQFVIEEQVFDPFDLIDNNKLLDNGTLTSERTLDR